MQRAMRGHHGESFAPNTRARLGLRAASCDTEPVLCLLWSETGKSTVDTNDLEQPGRHGQRHSLLGRGCRHQRSEEHFEICRALRIENGSESGHGRCRAQQPRQRAEHDDQAPSPWSVEIKGRHIGVSIYQRC